MTGETGTRIAGWMIAASLPLTAVGGGLFTLALTSGQDQPLASAPFTQRLAMLAGGAGIFLIGAITGMAGLAMYVLIPAFSGSERARRDYGSHRVILASSLLAAIAGNLLAAAYLLPAAFLSGTPAGGRLGTGGLISPVAIAVSAIALDLALLAVVYLRVVRPGVITWSRMGLEREGLGRRALLGLPLGLVLLAVGAALESVLEGVGVRQTQSEIFGSVRNASLPEFLLVLLAGAVIAPVVEEIYFRGFVFRAYLEQKGVKRAFIFSAALFALVHLNLPALLPILALGLMLALFYYRTGSIVPGMVAHALNNAAAFMLLYLS